MSEQPCNCGEQTTAQAIERTASASRWPDEQSILTASLPADVRKSLSRFLGESVETLDEFVEATRTATGGGPLTVEDLCHTDAKTPHYATVDDETYHFSCFYDGIVLAHIADELVEIRTESPAGEPIELVASPDGGIDVTPPDAVMSFGIASDVEPPDADGSPADHAVVAAICPYVQAFTTRRSYENWAAAVDAATVGMPLEDGVPIAAALAERA